MCLRLDWCSHTAAKFAVEHWHYSRSMPAGKIVKIGVWEYDVFIGCVLFSRGATNNIGKPYYLDQVKIAELTRVALSAHQAPVSRIVAIAITILRKQSPGLRLLVSYADPEQGHVGGIYQAMNWIYTGKGKGDFHVLIDGEWVHRRNAHSKYGTSKGLQRKAYGEKHKYLYPLDAAMKAQIEPLRQPYPKRIRAASIEADVSAVQAEEGGAVPTAALHHMSS